MFKIQISPFFIFKKRENRTFLIVMAFRASATSFYCIVFNATDLSRISNIYTTQVNMEAQESNKNE
jgi:hypothetical protein